MWGVSTTGSVPRACDVNMRHEPSMGMYYHRGVSLSKSPNLYHERGIEILIATVRTSRVGIELDHDSLQPTTSVGI